jgi:hypothetical protein
VKSIEKTISQRLQSIRRLIEDPAATAGEKENARALFRKLLTKYGLTEADLLDDERYIFKFTFEDQHERKLLFQTIAKVTNQAKTSYWPCNPEADRPRKSKNAIWIELTKAEGKEIKFLYDTYLFSFRTEIRNFVSGFIHANMIFPESSDDEEHKPLTPEERKRLLRIALLASHIEPTHIPRDFPMLEERGIDGK